MEKEEITIKYRKLNKVEKDCLEQMRLLAKSAHFIDIKFRDNGKDKFLQADFLREIIQQLK